MQCYFFQCVYCTNAYCLDKKIMQIFFRYYSKGADYDTHSIVLQRRPKQRCTPCHLTLLACYDFAFDVRMDFQIQFSFLFNKK